MRNCWRVCRTKRGSMSMRPVTSRIGYGSETWCFRADLYTVFKIDPTRSGDVLIEVLGKEFDGVLGCDYFSAYRRYHREFGVTLQVLFGPFDTGREVFDDAARRESADVWDEVARGVARLFGVIHRREQLTAPQFQSQLKAARGGCCGLRYDQRAGESPLSQSGEASSRRMARVISGSSRPREWSRPTIWRSRRFGSWVIDRLITPRGHGVKRKPLVRTDLDRDRDVRAAQGRSVFAYLEAAVGAWFADTEPPLLLPGI